MLILQRTFPFKFRLIPCMKIRLIYKKTKGRMSLDLQRDLHHVTYIVDIVVPQARGGILVARAYTCILKSAYS